MTDSEWVTEKVTPVTIAEEEEEEEEKREGAWDLKVKEACHCVWIITAKCLKEEETFWGLCCIDQICMEIEPKQRIILGSSSVTL